jgi:hypothetical protein
MDYRKMLAAYITHVGAAEGTDFLGNGPSAGVLGLMDEENIELAKVRDEMLPYHYRYYDADGNPISDERRKELVEYAERNQRTAKIRQDVEKLLVELTDATERGSLNAADRIVAQLAEKTAALEKLTRTHT